MTRRRAFIVDLNKCTGCHACETACQIANAVPGKRRWRRVRTFNELHVHGVEVVHLSLACNHCASAPCMDACPARSYYRDEATGAVLIDQSGAGATCDLPNGLSVRLEAPLDWRVKETAFREGLTETEARLRVRGEERERAYLDKVYAVRYPRKPAHHLAYDCSAFSLAHIAQHVVYAMKMKGCI